MVDTLDMGLAIGVIVFLAVYGACICYMGFCGCKKKEEPLLADENV